MLKIVADKNIPFVQSAFATLGEVRLMPGRDIAAAVLRDADMLLVRSITEVNAALLAGTPVKFVGTATIGMDHLDCDYLHHQKITYASAAGCNANAVAEYLCAALLFCAVQRNLTLENLTIGIVGVGNVGSKVAAKAAALGLRVLLNDPPRARRLTGAEREQSPFLPLPELLQADLITLHTPLTHSGPHATFHLFDENTLRRMKPGSLLINTARGAVVDNAALKAVLRDKHLSAAILDVWENEPQIDAELLQHVMLATPHIAGYSFEGKLRATQMIYEAACRFLQVKPEWDATPFIPNIDQPIILLDRNILDGNRRLNEAVRHTYDIAADDYRLRQGFTGSQTRAESQGRWFDRLRHDYVYRREFSNYLIKNLNEDEPAAAVLRGIGFKVNGDESEGGQRL
ncbi:4-phosphoerythronate dehydrogenase PdxB [candidate division KSB1 bacterium]|nr:4-phosphoerythronate dehydrogenase PdxB [candidate division KSB1 bacterium]